MGKIRLPKGSSVTSNNGGIANSGIFGFFGSTTHCDSNDKSFYCNTMKIFNLFIVLLFFLYVLYFGYNFLKTRV